MFADVVGVVIVVKAVMNYTLSSRHIAQPNLSMAISGTEIEGTYHI